MAELQERMAYAEFVEWMAFASVEPLPQARADLHTALLMYLIASSNRKKGDKRLKLEKFMLDFWASSGRDPRALERKFRVLTGAQGAPASDEPSVESVPRGEPARASVADAGGGRKEISANVRRA